MNSGSMNHEGSESCIGERDRLSELPDEVIVHILSLLPTLDAVRTVLLRRFGNLWTLVPTLDFSDHQLRPPYSANNPEWNNSTALFPRFLLFVRNVLKLHKRPTIDGFLIDTNKYINWDKAYMVVTEIDAWIRFALSREVKKLSLDFGWNNKFFPLPSFIYTSHSLVILKLRGCRIELPSRIHLRSLRTLDIANVSVDEDDNFNEFVCGCLSLQELHISESEVKDMQVLRSSTIVKLELVQEESRVSCTIDCPNLKILDIYVNYPVIVNIPSVREVTIRAFTHVCEEGAHNFKRFLEGVEEAQVLTFADVVDRHLTYCSTVNVGFPYNRWKRVVLNSSLQDSFIIGICTLIRNSPCLEELIIHTRHINVIKIGSISKFVFQEASSPCVVPHLKVISMHGYRNSYEGQLRLAEFLLKSAINLEKFVVFSDQVSQLTSANGLQFVKELSKLPKASAKAMLMFE